MDTISASTSYAVLFITFNGLADHIGGSQILPYLTRLASNGHTIIILSAEKKANYSSFKDISTLLSHSGIIWYRTEYLLQPKILGQLFTQFRMHRLAHKIIARHKISLLHCRSHPAALIGEHVFNKHRIPYIFDFRDFYPDGGLQKAHGLKRLLFLYLKYKEKALIQKSSHIVCLTDRAKAILSQSYFDADFSLSSHFSVIPCCADFSLFDPAVIKHADQQKIKASLNIPNNSPVLLYLGALGPDYLLEPMLLLYKQYQLLYPTSIFLFLINNGHQSVQQAARSLGIPLSNIRFVTVERQSVPLYISLATISVVFIRPTSDKAGCSPTKLAELFAMNIPVIANTGVGDLDKIISLRQNSSTIVPNFDVHTLRSSIVKVLSSQSSTPDIRTRSERFDISHAVNIYSSIYHSLLKTTTHA